MLLANSSLSSSMSIVCWFSLVWIEISMIERRSARLTRTMKEFPDTIKQFSSLQVLGISDIEFKNFDINWLANPYALESLKIKDCNLETITLVVSSDEPINLELLNLSGNKSIELNPQEFDFPKLECLVLSACGFDSLDKEMFSKLPRLRSLDLDDNELESLEGFCDVIC